MKNDLGINRAYLFFAGLFLLLVVCGSTCEENDDDEEINLCDRDCMVASIPGYTECKHQYWNCIEENPIDYDQHCIEERDQCYKPLDDALESCYNECRSCNFNFKKCVDECGGREECDEAYDVCVDNLEECQKDWYSKECNVDCASEYAECIRIYFERPEVPDFDRLHECEDEAENCFLSCY